MSIIRACFGGISAFALVAGSSGQATSAGLEVKTVAEVQLKAEAGGRAVVKLAPADRVAPGDQVVYTLEIRNAGSVDVVRPVVTNPIPAHMTYIPGSAAGPGADVSYSTDGGRRFQSPSTLMATGPDGRSHAASAKDYTHIRWKLKSTLKPNSVAFARFRAVVK